MDIIPLTLVISLLLSLTFIALFVREFSRPQRAGAERDSLLPLADDAPVAVYPRHHDGEESSGHSSQGRGYEHAHEHDQNEVCASRRNDGKCCGSCRRRQERAAAKSAPTSAV